MHPKHAKIKINISACVINLFYAPQFETGWLHLKASWIWARNGTNHRHLFLVRKWHILSHFIILSESHTSPESYFPHRCPGKKFTIIWSLLTFQCSIYGSMDQMITVIDCISESHRVNSQLSVGFMRSLVLLHWHKWLPMGSMIAKWTASDAVIVNSKDASESCQQNACPQYDAIQYWCNRSFPSVKCVWSTVWWSHVLRKLAHVYSPPCKSAGAKRWGMRGQAWNSWFDWLNLYDSTRRMPKDIQTWKSSILRSLTLRILDSRGRFWGDQLSLPTRDVRKLSMFTWQSTMILYNTNQQAFKMMWYVDV